MRRTSPAPPRLYDTASSSRLSQAPQRADLPQHDLARSAPDDLAILHVQFWRRCPRYPLGGARDGPSTRIVAGVVATAVWTCQERCCWATCQSWGRRGSEVGRREGQGDPVRRRREWRQVCWVGELDDSQHFQERLEKASACLSLMSGETRRALDSPSLPTTTAFLLSCGPRPMLNKTDPTPALPLSSPASGGEALPFPAPLWALIDFRTT